MKIILLLISSIVLLCCSSSKKMNQIKENNPEKETPNEIKSAILGDLNQSSFPSTIFDAKVKDNVLRLSIGYTGGCTKHNFELIGNEMISKSLPPIRSMKLIHTTIDEEACKKEMFDTLYFNIANLAYKKTNGSVIKLNLEGFKEQIVYTYK